MSLKGQPAGMCSQMCWCHLPLRCTEGLRPAPKGAAPPTLGFPWNISHLYPSLPLQHDGLG